MRILVLITALLWAGVSGWWYTCNIKGYCDIKPKTATLTSHIVLSDKNADENSSELATKSQDNDTTIEATAADDSNANNMEADQVIETSTEDNATNDVTDGGEDTAQETETDIQDSNGAAKDAENTETNTTPEDTVSSLEDATLAAEDELPNPLEEDIPAEDDNDDTKIKIDRVKNAYPDTDVTPEIKKVRIYSPSAASNPKDLNTNAARYFDKVIEMLKADETLEIVLTGYTDSKGGEARNKALGLRRAKTLKAIFVAKGAPADRILTESQGEANPIWSNKTEDGRKKNRRVELESKNKE